MYKRILIATDGSQLSDMAVESGLSLAGLTGASVIALKVVPRYPRSYFDGTLPVEAADIKRIEKQWSDAAQVLVNKVKARGSDEGVSVKAVVVKSDLIAESIISAARKHKADLVVMASHGRRGLGRVLLGSQTQAVLARSTVPVLIVR